jgi:cyclase
MPSLLLKDGGLVKTERFERPRYVGDPVNAVRIFNEKEVDELLLLDIDASRLGRAPDFALLKEIAGECFMPLCYGGGIRSMEDAERLFAIGVEKLCLQTAAMQDLGLVSRIAARYGRQSVLVSADVERVGAGYVLRRSPRVRGGDRGGDRNWLDFVKAAAGAGAGEIVVNAVHRDGTLAGPDLELVRQAASAVSVPVVAAGGIASLDDIRDAVMAGASAVSVGAYFVFYGPHRAVLITYPRYNELEALLAGLR